MRALRYMRHASLIQLSHDHHHGLALALRCRKQALGQIKPLGLEGLRERSREFRGFFTASLENHFRAEEEILFAQMRAHVPESRAIIDQLVREHDAIRNAMPGLQNETGLGKTIFDLGDLLERHIRKEERELFPLFEHHLDKLDGDAIADSMKQRLAQPARGR